MHSGATEICSSGDIRSSIAVRGTGAAGAGEWGRVLVMDV